MGDEHVGLTQGFQLLAFTIALQYISSAVLTIFIGLAPVFTASMAHLWLAQEQLDPRKWLGLTTGFAGVLLLILTRTSGLAGITAGLAIRGQLLALAGALISAAGIVYARRQLREGKRRYRNLIWPCRHFGVLLLKMIGSLSMEINMALVEISQMDGRIPVTVFQLQDRVNLGNYAELEQTAKDAYEKGMRDLVIDLSKTPSLTSIGVRALVVIHRMLSTATGVNHLKLAGPMPYIREMLQISGITQYIEIFNTVDEAVASF